MKKSVIALLAAMALALAACGPEPVDVSAADGADASQVTETESTNAGTADIKAGEDEPSATDAAVEAASDPAPSDTASAVSLRSSILQDALDEKTSSGRFEGTFNFVGGADSDLPGEVTMKFSGAYDLPNNAAELSIDFSGLIAAASAGADPSEVAMMEAFFADPMQLITIDDVTYIKWSLLSLFTGTEGKWLQAEAGDTEEIAGMSGIGTTSSPVDILELLADADAEVTEVGTEELRGVTTTRYEALVDVEALAEDMTAEALAEFKANVGAAPVAKFPLNLWIDEDGLLHRFSMDLSDPDILDAAEGDMESAQVTYDFWDHGKDMNIESPNGDEILDEDEWDIDFSDFAG